MRSSLVVGTLIFLQERVHRALKILDEIFQNWPVQTQELTKSRSQQSANLRKLLLRRHFLQLQVATRQRVQTQWLRIREAVLVQRLK